MRGRDGGDWFDGTLWQFMEIFGPIIRDHPFVNNELHFHGESYVRTDQSTA